MKQSHTSRFLSNVPLPAAGKSDEIRTRNTHRTSSTRALAKELATKAGLDPSSISLLESDQRTPGADTVATIARALQLPAHLFSLLAAEPDDLVGIAPAQAEHLAAQLLELLLRSDGQDLQPE